MTNRMRGCLRDILNEPIHTLRGAGENVTMVTHGGREATERLLAVLEIPWGVYCYDEDVVCPHLSDAYCAFLGKDVNGDTKECEIKEKERDDWGY